MGQWSRAEIEEAFAEYQRRAAASGASGDWRPWADLFTEDAEYIEHLYGRMHGREAIYEWIQATMSEYPGSEMPEFPIEWYTIDEDKGWVICQVWNRMRDPGRRHCPPGVQHHHPEVRRRRSVVVGGGRLQPHALRHHAPGLGGGAGRGSRRPEATRAAPEPAALRLTGVERRRLGRTGHQSSVAVLGGAAFGRSDPETTAASFTEALDAGVNHLDVAPQYGRAQELLGPLIPAVRDRLFVACKTLRHDPDGVRAQLEESLTLLQCDAFDLYQLHAVTDLAELDAR